MRGSKNIIVALGAISLLATTGEASPPIMEPPSPCPCCADGACYPKRETWGWYKNRWRKWPTDTRPDIPGTDEPGKEGQLPPGLRGFERPPAGLEDRRAPESFKERQERIRANQLPLPAQPGPGAPGPGLPPGPQPGLQPFAPAPAPDAPQGGFNFDQPPRPPANAPLGPAPLDDGGQAPPLNDFQLPLGPAGDLQGNLDQPPSLPQGLARLSGGGRETDLDTIPAIPSHLIRGVPIVARLPVQAASGAVIPASATESPSSAPQVGRAVYRRSATSR